MSNQVINSVPYHDPAQALLDLERFESTPNATTPFSLFRGPFGVSKLSQVPELEASNYEFDGVSSLSEEWLTGLDDLIRQEDNEIGLISGLLDVPHDQVNDGLELWDLTPEILNSALYTPGPGLSPKYFSDNAEAWNILSHYKDRIVPLISPLGHGQEAPWLNLVMPCAVSALGDITMSGATTHARLALLNALLSTGAFHLGHHSPLCTEHWVSTGNIYLKRAQSHFLRCVEETCTSTTKRSKYKEILMAILSLSTAYVGSRPFIRSIAWIEEQLTRCLRWLKEIPRAAYPASSKPRNSSASTASNSPPSHRSGELYTTATRICES